MHRVATALLALAFLGTGGVRPGVNPSCPHHQDGGGPMTTAAPAAHGSEATAVGDAESAAVGHATVGASSSADRSHGSGEDVPCCCGSGCECSQARSGESLLPAVPDGPAAERPDRVRALRRSADERPRDRAMLLPWPNGPPAL